MTPKFSKDFSCVQQQTTPAKKYTYLVLYAPGYLYPGATGVGSHNTGDSFKKVAQARNKINLAAHPTDICKIHYTPSEWEFFNRINTATNIKQLDIYAHGWLHGINLGGFTDKRMINSVEVDGSTIDWLEDAQDKGRDMRRVEIHENLYIAGSTQTSELPAMKRTVFDSSANVYIWGCNIGGQLSPSGVHVGQNPSPPKYPDIPDPKSAFAQAFAKRMGVGNVHALVGKGVDAGSMFKTDAKGNNYYDDGEMIPANISFNHGNKNTKGLSAYDYMKKFPLP